MSATAAEEASGASLNERIDRMHRRDRMGAIAFVLALWVVVLFVMFSIWPNLTNPMIRNILVVSGIGILILNTAAILAMLRHYEHDKHFIYSLDIMHLDEMRKRRRAKG
jgi:Co/Zn/Cd efflux system component